MIQFLIVVILIVAVLLTIVVLAQSSKGSGLTGSFGASAASQIMGAKRTTDFLEKLTWGFVACILLFSLVANIMPKGDRGMELSPNIEAAKKKQVAAPANPAPAISTDSAAQIQPVAPTDSAK